MNRILVLGCCCAFAFVAAASPAFAGPKDDLIAADKAFSDLSVAKGTSPAFLAYLADDGCLFGSEGAPTICTKAAYAKAVAARKPSNGPRSVLRWVPDAAQVSADGTFGFTHGAWTLDGAPDAQGKRERQTGHYLTNWRKDASGAWKVVADMGSTDPAPAKAK